MGNWRHKHLHTRRMIRWWPLLALIGLTLLFFHQLAFSDHILGRGDTYAYFYPYWHARNAALLAGDSGRDDGRRHVVYFIGADI